MRVFVNDIELRTYCGAKVKAAVLAYLKAKGRSLNLQNIAVKDAFGNFIDLDGSLRADMRIYVTTSSC